MATTQNISLNKPAYYDESGLELAAIERRRKLSEALQAQAMQPIEQQTAGGYVIPISPWQGLAKLAQGAAAGYGQYTADKEQKKIADDYRTAESQTNTRLQAALRGDVGPVDIGRDAQVNTSIEALGGTPPARPTMSPEERKAAVMSILAEHPNPAIRNLPIQMQLAALTKNPADAFAKIDPSKFKPESVRKFAASGSYADLEPLKPLHFVDNNGVVQGVDPYSGAPVGTGTAKVVSPDAQARLTQANQQWMGLSGNQQAQNAIAQANLALHGQQVGIEGNNSFYNTGMAPPPLAPFQGGSGPQVGPQAAPQGPIPGTAVPPAPGAAPPPAGPVPAQPGPVIPASRTPTPVDFPRVSPQDQAIRNAESARLIAAEGQPGGGGLIPTNTVVPSVPVPGAAPGTKPIIETVTPKERQVLLVAQPHAVAAATTTLQNIDRLGAMADELKTHKGLSGITGRINQYSALDVMPATRDARALSDSMLNQVGIQALQAMRDASKTGGAVGQVTEREWPILQQSIAALSNAQTTAGYKTALTNLRNQLDESSGRIRSAYEGTYGKLDYKGTPHTQQGRSSAPAQTAPQRRATDIDALIKQYSG